MKKRQEMAAILAAAMTMTLLAGCGNGAKTDGGGAAASETAAEGVSEVNGIDTSTTYEATMVLIGSQQADQQLVLDKINEILLRDINTKLNIVMLSMGDFTTQLPLMLQGGDKVDRLCGAVWCQHEAGICGYG